MQLLITGVHQRNAPVDIRERLAFDPAMLDGALRALASYVDEALIISTCNRVEIYACASDTTDASALERFLAWWHGVPADEIAPHLYTLTGSAAVTHAFRVAAGLDSMVLGEEQIVCQIKGAMASAHAAGVFGPTLRRLIDGALTAGKLARTHTGIARCHVSVVSVALDLARQALGTLANQQIVVVGAGRTAELALKQTHGDVARQVTVVNRTDARAAELAARYGVACAPFGQLPALLASADVVISCTAAPGLMIDAAMVEQALADRVRPLLLLDLAVPRDIDRAAAALPGVLLFDVDGLQEVCEANRAARAAEVAAAEVLVGIEVDKFKEWLGTQQIVPTIRALRERAEAIRTAELQRTLARLPDLSPREQAAIGALSAAIVNKLLHQPIATLKSPSAGVDLAEALHELFQL